MNREIKFRAWHNILKVMLYPPNTFDSMPYCRPHTYIEIPSINIGWDSENNVAVQKFESFPLVAIIDWFGNWFIGGQLQDAHIMQYTGLKDKNEKEIYEADVIKINLPLGGFWGDIKKQENGVVKYDEEKAGFIVDWSKYKYGKNQSFIRIDCDIAFTSEIIGNIYEHPHLLTPSPASKVSDVSEDQ